MKTSKKLMQLLFIALLVFSCDKQEVALENNKTLTETANTNPYNFNVKVTNGVLVFNTREDFDSAITYLNENSPESFKEFEDNLNYTSMRSVTTVEAREKIAIYDDLLATLINPDAMIEINGAVFKLDALNDTVKMVNTKDYNDVSSFNSRNAHTFSTDDDILSILDGTEEVDNLGTMGYCGRQKAGPYSINVGASRVEYKTVYQSAGFMRSLVANIKSIGSSRPYIELKTLGSNFYKNSKMKKPKYLNRSKGGYNRVYDYRPYSSSRRLKLFRFSIEYFIESVQRYTLIQC